MGDSYIKSEKKSENPLTIRHHQTHHVRAVRDVRAELRGSKKTAMDSDHTSRIRDTTMEEGVRGGKGRERRRKREARGGREDRRTTAKIGHVPAAHDCDGRP